ncbi:MAG: hypothetical protein L0K86_06065 [Actinomycetia bacterium]|nr:hypothetical protein [Actinomycetes bacterium]
MSMGAGNGQWVRARDKQGAEAFCSELDMEAERQRNNRAQFRFFMARMFDRIKSWLRRS